MKTLSTILSFCLILIINSCNNTPKSSSKSEKLFIKTSSITGVDKNQVRKEAISDFTSDYFEVELNSLTTGGYGATKQILKPESIENYKDVFFYIVNKDGSSITFTTSTEFLNFMSAHGYDLVNQIPDQYGGDYTFKKKK
jgi:hypothetical protein